MTGCGGGCRVTGIPTATIFAGLISCPIITSIAPFEGASSNYVSLGVVGDYFKNWRKIIYEI